MPKTEVVRVDEPEALDRAVSILRGGGLIGIPTDTVYGLAASAWNGAAVKQLYEVKGRNEHKSVPVLISGASAIDEVATEPLERIQELAEGFWPGPLTLVVYRRSELPSEISAADTVGIRAPDHEFTLALLRKVGPLAATSANLSGQPSATTVAQVIERLGGKVDLVIDGGETPGGVPSSVVDLTVNPPALLREGPVAIEAVLKLWADH